MITQSSSTMMAPQPGIMVPPVQQHGGQCRGNAKIVAYVNIVFVILYMILIGVVILLVVYVLIVGYASSGFLILMIFIMIILVIVIAFEALELWIALGLLKATNLGTPPLQALEKAKCYRNYNIFLVIFNLVSGGGGFTIRANQNVFLLVFAGLSSAIFLLRLLFIYIVHNFIQDLQRVGGPMMMGGMGAMAYTNSQYLYQQQPYQTQQQTYQTQQQSYQNQQVQNDTP